MMGLAEMAIVFIFVTGMVVVLIMFGVFCICMKTGKFPKISFITKHKGKDESIETTFEVEEDKK